MSERHISKENNLYRCPSCGTRVNYNQLYCNKCKTLLVLPNKFVKKNIIQAIVYRLKQMLLKVKYFIKLMRSIIFSSYVKYVFGWKFILIFLIPAIFLIVVFLHSTYIKINNYRSGSQSFYDAFTELYLHKPSDLDSAADIQSIQRVASLGNIKIGSLWTDIDTKDSYQSNGILSNGALGYEKQGLTVYVRDNNITGLFTENSNYKTEKDISVGDSLDKAQRKYNNKLTIVSNNKTKKYITYSLDSSGKKVENYFYLNDENKIVAIEMLYSYTDKDYAYHTVLSPIMDYMNRRIINPRDILANSNKQKYSELLQNYKLMLAGARNLKEVSLVYDDNYQYIFKVPLDSNELDKRLGVNWRLLLQTNKVILEDSAIDAWAEVYVAKSEENSWYIWEIKLNCN